MTNSLRDRLLRTDTEAWNNEWYVYVGLPVFAALGVLLGRLFGVHAVSSTAGELLVVSLFTGLSVAVGLAVLALLDR